MRLLPATVLVCLLTACASIAGVPDMPTDDVPAGQVSAPNTFTPGDFAQLRFLAGRWQGTGPDGSAFYEEYSFPSASQMRSARHADASFAGATDGSVVELTDAGQVTSTWNEFTWRASELAPGRACFTPVNAPSSFCWERYGDDRARVTQRWTDDQGRAQEVVVPLRRL